MSALSLLILLLPPGGPAGAAGPSSAPPSGSIEVRVTNLRNLGKGRLYLLLYRKVGRIGVDLKNAFKVKSVKVGGRRMTVTLPDIPYGQYALALLHDMDGDRKLDTTWLGIPDEDIGVSNNARGGPLGGPKWKKAKFHHRSRKTRPKAIKMVHFYG